MRRSRLSPLFSRRPLGRPLGRSLVMTSLCLFSCGLIFQNTVLLGAPVAEKPIPAPSAPQFKITRLDIEAVHNALQLGPKIISGSCPHAEAGYKALAKQGVKTIVSVDGAPTEVEVAKKFGMRYVHIPIEYGGVPRDAALKIARAIRDLPGPIFVHCHHGIHRGPAAVALALIATQGWPTEDALKVLEVAGTAPSYSGLWSSVREFKTPTKAELDKIPNEFPARAPVPAMAAAMASIDARWEHLGDVRAAGWKSPANHPDIDPPHEALLLRETFRELAREEATAKKHPAEFLKMMQASEFASAELEAALRLPMGDATRGEKAEKAFKAVGATCKSCHTGYRNNTLNNP